MGNTTAQDAAETEGEGVLLTELEKLEVTRIDGVASPANGFPVLLMKGLPAKLEPPTQAGFTGTYGGVAAPDAGDAAGCGCCDECQCAPAAAAKAAEPGAGWWVYPTDEVAKDSREFSAADRKRNASAGNALPDGSYPIPDADALRRAAILARSKHGNWKAARRLIARRAKELGVDNPLASNDGDADDKPKAKAGAASKSVAEGEAGVDTGAQGEQIATLVQAEVAKALKPHEEREQALEAELAKANAKIAEFAARPVPGGPVIRAVTPPESSVKKAELAAKAEEFEELARTVSDPERSANFAKLAAQKRAEALRA